MTFLDIFNYAILLIYVATIGNIFDNGRNCHKCILALTQKGNLWSMFVPCFGCTLTKNNF